MSVPQDPTAHTSLAQIQAEVCDCFRCPRLVTWRQSVALNKVKRHIDETYWGRAVPSWGDPEARLGIVGLAPAAHGANRTGRMFTGDRSGDWLFRALYRAGFANQPHAVHREDGLTLADCYIMASVHCAPPDNKPTPDEFAACRPYLQAELRLLTNLRVLVALGKIAFDTVLKEPGFSGGRPRPAFGHGVQVPLENGVLLIGSYHPSQQNTFTGKLTEPMFDAVFTAAKSAIVPVRD